MFSLIYIAELPDNCQAPLNLNGNKQSESFFSALNAANEQNTVYFVAKYFIEDGKWFCKLAPLRQT